MQNLLVKPNESMHMKPDNAMSNKEQIKKNIAGDGEIRKQGTCEKRVRIDNNDGMWGKGKSRVQGKGESLANNRAYRDVLVSSL